MQKHGPSFYVSFHSLFFVICLFRQKSLRVVVAQFYGAGDKKEVRTNASSGILFLIVLGIAAAVIGLIIARLAYVHLVNVPEDYMELTVLYFRIYAVGLVFQFG